VIKMSNHVRQRDYKRGGSRHTNIPRYRKSRPKSFKTEDAAKAWLKEQGIEKFKLRNLKSDEAKVKKIIVEY
jgi:hypothetical protein